MSETKIEWCDYSINPVKGLCPVGCSYCYARRHYQRFHLYKDGTPNPTWDYTIRFDVHGYQDAPDWNMESIKEPSKIFVGSTMELFGEWIEPRWLEVLFQVIRRYPQHTFIFLTKRPENLIKWSPFPENCWVGVSATDNYQFKGAMKYLIDVQATIKFISFEPLLSEVFVDPISFQGVMGWRHNKPHPLVQWLIIGQQTPASPRTAPKIEWVKEIVEAADKAGIPVFLKDNLRKLLKPWQGTKDYCRQEYPKEVPHVG